MQRVTYAVTALVPGPSKHPLLQHPLLQHPRQLLQPNSCSCCCSPSGNGQLSCIACPSQCGSRVFGADRKGMIDGAATAVRTTTNIGLDPHIKATREVFVVPADMARWQSMQRVTYGVTALVPGHSPRFPRHLQWAKHRWRTTWPGERTTSVDWRWLGLRRRWPRHRGGRPSWRTAWPSGRTW